ncbi:DNA primase [Yaniella halotolerans]|uniref:DNA primase n=1 Tax=Yaniella halotolerans TaxID=225453 RepID=UPI0003B4235B|nr:DNA primase [Yaniella halotolerans]
MAGRITRASIDKVLEVADLKSVVEEHVSLRTAGIGSFKGLCPFHDERTPSFHVTPAKGFYHCFGCQESGDAIKFLMEIEHTSFTETVELLAARANVSLEYEEGDVPDRPTVATRQRMLQAHQIADEFYQEAINSPAGAEGRNFLTNKGFTKEDAQRFGVGYAPGGWNNLLSHLQERGFSVEELTETGLFSEGRRGLYDRFRNRLMWPIKDMTGNTIGFGARQLDDDDNGPKYLNTPETSLYKKSQVLYGLNMAKSEVARKRQLVVVEGYTDVMAAHLAGITTAVATCGTAFGEGHVRIARRLITDDGSGGEIVFTFDGDEAGQKAAMRAFEFDNQIVAKTFVAVAPQGQDPNDLRQHYGDEAVQQLIESREPLFEFAIKTRLKDYNLDSVEGRTGALHYAAPIVNEIRDPVMRDGYVRELAGWLGMDVDAVHSAVQRAPKASAIKASREDHQTSQSGETAPEQNFRPDLRDPVARMEKEALEVILQRPESLSQEQWKALFTSQFKVPVYRAIQAAILAAARNAQDTSNWVQHVTVEVPQPLYSFVTELAVAPLPASTEEDVMRYSRDIMNRLLEMQITEQKADLIGKLQRWDSEKDPEGFQAIQQRLVELENQRRFLRPID